MIKLISKYQDGNIISPEKLALSRANKLYNNYCLSKDVEISIPMTMWYNTRRFLKIMFQIGFLPDLPIVC